MSLAGYLNQIKSRKDGLILVLAVILAGTLGLGLGRWSKLVVSPEPLEISNVPESSVPVVAETGESKNFVASKNGTKYYLPNCSGASRIKEENKVWFASAEEARARGLMPASGCPGL